MLLFVPSFILLLYLINYVICFATRCRTPACSTVSLGGSQRNAIPQKDRVTRSQYDFSLLSALLDHWRPETHTFHFTVSEMTVTLQDMSLLMGLPCEGEPLGPADISPSGVRSSSLGSLMFLEMTTSPPRTRSLRTLTDPP
jgi:hypothetical protein